MWQLWTTINGNGANQPTCTTQCPRQKCQTWKALASIAAHLRAARLRGHGREHSRVDIAV